MGLKDFFKKKKTEEADFFDDLCLEKMKKGYMVDYDLKTWEVTAYSYYDWGEGDKSYEWQLTTQDDLFYLELSVDDEKEWSISRAADISDLPVEILDEIRKNGNPPDEVKFKAQIFYLEETGGGHFYKDGSDRGKEFLQWSYEDDEGEKYLTVEQWGDTDFAASWGGPVEEYQFINILPR
jgi:hypothetical protein